ncbi:MAG: ABC transporter ATP-binding protein [Desulfarculus sp.]|nr:ABC transporter ATP-binding protein [Desulfarculus sp.]
MALLEVENLSIGYRTKKGVLQAVDNVSFSVEAGRSLGLVGESGCGKTTIGMALMGLLPRNGRVTAGTMRLMGRDMLGLSREQWRELRWKEIAMIFQAAMNALNPVQRVDQQIAEAILTHNPGLSRGEAHSQVEGLYQLVGLPLERLRDYPHQYSGGMKQRAIIAMALACNPKIIVADEPTTALDVIVQDQILQETKALQKEFNIGIIFISHDISIVAEVCHHIAIMYAGQMVETGTTDEVFRDAKHPYTRALLGSFPALGGERRPLRPIPGEPPLLVGQLMGCRFCDRCPVHGKACKLEPPQRRRFSDTHFALCDHCD